MIVYSTSPLLLTFYFVVFAALDKLGLELGGLSLFWHVHDISPTGLSLGLLVSINTAAAMISYLLAGVVFDFLPRLRRTLWVIVTVASGILFILIASTTELTIIYLTVFIIGLIGGFGVIFYQASLSLAFSSSELVRVNSLIRIIYSIIALAVPVTAGLIVDKYGSSVALILADTILICRTPLTVAIANKVSSKSRESGEKPLKVGQRGSLKGLIDIIRFERKIISIMLVLSFSEVFLAVVPTLHLLLLVESLGGGASEVGFLWTVMALGGLIASLVIGVVKPEPKPHYIRVGVLGLALLALILSMARRLEILVVVSLLWGVVASVLLVITDSFIQSSAPSERKGTVISLRNLLDDLGYVFSGVVSGTLIDFAGLRPSLLIASAASAVLGAILLALRFEVSGRGGLKFEGGLWR